MKIKILITGVSSGLGYDLAKIYLKKGEEVFGCSRRCPNELVSQGLNFCSIDFSDQIETQKKISNWLKEVGNFNIVILNAAKLGIIEDIRDAKLGDLKETMQINMWANKSLLDELLKSNRKVNQVIAISSGASITGNRGWNGYSLSKASLNMFIKLYAAECTDTHFISLAPGLINTAMQDYLTSLPSDPKYPAIEILKESKHSAKMPTSEDCAKNLIATFPNLLKFPSGDYVDIRKI